MTPRHIANVQPLPSSILHNSTDVRRQQTRIAAQHFARFLNRKLHLLNRKVAQVAPDMTQTQGGH